ncbi:hypothetical protein Dxin01_00110 [Deinococcus xinjiangensis]|uniref:Uncharacterized protein n=1 Tax=Deinococcus xinjiangensis TaxID=457454 RepID=A0ABP9V529_9DEIO
MSDGELLPDWNFGSRFRRYLVLPKPLPLADSVRLRDALKAREREFYPYLPMYVKGGVILVPRNDDFEKFYLLPQEQVCFAMTRRDPEHDAALNRALGIVDDELRRMETERELHPYSLGKVMCDDCGAHENHRSRRMIQNNWPVADGEHCAPWQGAWFDVVYGNKEHEWTIQERSSP